MDRKTVLTKTAKGLQEVSGKTKILSRDLRALLKEVDGKATIATFAPKFEKLSEEQLLAALGKLESDGFVREFVPAVRDLMPRPRPVRPAAAAPAAAGEELDFTAPRASKPDGSEEAAVHKESADQLAHVAAAARAREEAEARARADAAARAAADPVAKAVAEAAAKVRLAAEADARARAEAETRLRAEAEARARAEAESKARAEAEARVRAEAEARARQEAADKVRRAAEDKAKREAEDRAEEMARQEAEEKAKREADEKVRREAEDKAKRDAEERARQEAEEKAKREADEKARREAEAKGKHEAEEKARQEAEEKARREAEAKAKREAEEKARKEAEEKAKREADEKARREAEAKAKREAEATARKEAEEKAQREEEEKARREAEDKAKREAEATARKEAEEKARREAEGKAKREAEEQARKEAEEKAKREAEEKARREAEDKAKREAEEQARKEAEEKAQREAEEKARREADEKARREAEDKAKREAEERAREEADEKAQRAAEEKATREAEVQQRREQEEARKQREREARLAAENVEKAEKEQAKADAAAEAEAEAKARSEAKADAKAEAATRAQQRSVKVEAAAPVEIPAVARPRKQDRKKLGRTIGIALVAVVIVGLVALPFVPIDGASYEKAAQDRFGVPVRVGKVSFAMFPTPALTFDKVTIGTEPPVRIGTARAAVELGSLWNERKRFTLVALDSVAVPQQYVAAGIWGKAKDDLLRIERVKATGVKLELAGMELPILDLDASAGAEGRPGKLTLTNAERKISLQLSPEAGSSGFEISAGTLPLPFGGAVELAEFSGKGSLTASELIISEFDAKALGGDLKGNARLRWGDAWSLDGDLVVHQIDAKLIGAPLVSNGKLDGKLSYAMKAPSPDKLVSAARLEGSFNAKNGAIAGVDLTRVLQGGGAAGGTTWFTEMSGNVSADPARVQVKQLRMTASLLSATGALDVDAQKNLGGRFQVELRSPTTQIKSAVILGGTLKEPRFKR